jgi:hypothetical protein
VMRARCALVSAAHARARAVHDAKQMTSNTPDNPPLHPRVQGTRAAPRIAPCPSSQTRPQPAPTAAARVQVEEKSEAVDCDGLRESCLVNGSILHDAYGAAVDRKGHVVPWDDRANKAVWTWDKWSGMGTCPRRPTPRLPCCTEETIAEVIARIEGAGMSPEQ